MGGQSLLTTKPLLYWSCDQYEYPVESSAAVTDRRSARTLSISLTAAASLALLAALGVASAMTTDVFACRGLWAGLCGEADEGESCGDALVCCPSVFFFSFFFPLPDSIFGVGSFFLFSGGAALLLGDRPDAIILLTMNSSAATV